MSTRDELTKAIDFEVARDENWESQGNGYEALAVGATTRIADALIAEGWRKMPSRDEIAEAIVKDYYGVDTNRPAHIAWVWHAADQVLALMDRGQ